MVALHSDLRFENGVIPDGTQTFRRSASSRIWFENGVIPDGTQTENESCCGSA